MKFSEGWGHVKKEKKDKEKKIPKGSFELLKERRALQRSEDSTAG